MSTIQIFGLVILAIVIIYSIVDWYKKKKKKENPSEQSSEQPLPKSKKHYEYILLVLVILGTAGYFIWQYYQDKSVEIPLSEAINLSKQQAFSDVVLDSRTLDLTIKDGKEFTVKDVKDKEVTLNKDSKVTSQCGLLTYSELANIGFVLPEKFSGKVTYSSDIWGTYVYLAVVILLFGGAYWYMTRGNSQKFKKDKSSIRFSDVGGMVEAKDSLREIVDFLKDKKHFNNLGAITPRGVLLEGLPGNGKTMLARAVANEAGVDFYYTTGSEFHSMWVGVAASKIKNLFKQLKKKPCVLFIDEFDSIAHNRGSSGTDVGREWNHTLNQLLSEMDGFEKKTQIMILAATNRADVLDPAVLRAGRFDRKIVVPLPNYQDRIEILKIHLRGKPIASDINIESIAKQTSGFSGADIALLLNEAAILAGREKRVAISNDNICKAMDKVIAGEERKNHKLSSEEKNLIAVHESGHALVATMLKDADKVQRISILPRGQAGGFTRTASETEHIVLTQNKAMAMISVLLAGRASEEIILKEITSGAQSDLQKANEIAKEMVEHLGMSQNFGLRYVGSNSYGVKDIGIESQQIIEKDIKSILDKCYEIAKDTIVENKAKLEALVVKLIEKESVNIEEIANILK